MDKLRSPHLAAMILVAHFGTKAGVLAELRAGQFAKAGDEAGHLLWSTVAGLADRLVDDPRREPGWAALGEPCDLDDHLAEADERPMAYSA